MKPLSLYGLATAVPPHSIGQVDATALAESLRIAHGEHARLVPVVYKRSGVLSRHSIVLEGIGETDQKRQSFYWPAVDATDRGPTTSQRMQCYEREAALLAARAVADALAASGVSPSELTHLISVSCTGFAAPGFDLELVHRFSLPGSIARTQIGFMGCHGLFNALRVAQAFCNADPRSKILVVAVELCTLHQQYTDDAGQIIANALFADGAGAVVCGLKDREPPPAGAEAVPWKLARSGSLVLPASSDAMTWHIRDHGFQMALSPQVPELILANLHAWLAAWLGESGLAINDIRQWAVHPGGPKILHAVQQALELDRDQLQASQHVLAQFGNMSSPTVLFILNELRRIGAKSPCVMLGFGPGLTIEAALLI